MAKEQAANEELEVICNEEEVEMIESFYEFVEAS